ncbi:hypothetical protein B0H13DRAFT_1610668 [Mycena leptocephala]|nr:hypothetical protein B0H13DRAFT_1610668 [Mycena leptocephala]
MAGNNGQSELTPAPPTRTIPQRHVYSALQADFRSLMNGIQTQEQLDETRARLERIGREAEEDERQDLIRDPPTFTRKGRPLTQRLTGPTEGRARGGGAGIQPTNASQAARNRCGLCHQAGHNRRGCPLNKGT